MFGIQVAAYGSSSSYGSLERVVVKVFKISRRQRRVTKVKLFNLHFSVHLYFSV